MFYTYLWLREDGTPYYVGKGKHDRAFVHREGGISPPKDTCRILIQEFPTEDDALIAECFLVAYYGRKDLSTGCLRNRTDGGEGVSGYQYSEEQLLRRAEISRSRIVKESTRQKMREIAQSRLPISDETRQRMSAASRGRCSGMKGGHHSAETRAKQRAIKLGKPQSATLIAKRTRSTPARHRAAKIASQQRLRDAKGRYA